MKLSDFDYALPEELIALYPRAERSASRLLCLNAGDGSVAHRRFIDFPELLGAGDLLVFNDTRVIPARLTGRKETGGRVEVLVERVTDDARALCQVRANKTPKPGSSLVIDGEEGCRAEVEAREGDFFRLRFNSGNLPRLLERIGHMPLPPYIDRDDEQLDRERYQTIYAQRPGAVAAPTAGLHFDAGILKRLEAHGIETTFVTLHVGAGTFQPVRVEDVAEHRMHSEYIEVSQKVCEQIVAARARGGRVIAVGTTSVRSLETAAQATTSGLIAPFQGDTDIFIYPGYEFRCVDAMLTNFHLPKSTLLMLVSAFAGADNTRAAYQQAIEQRYRFFSYGDAMFLYSAAKCVSRAVPSRRPRLCRSAPMAR